MSSSSQVWAVWKLTLLLCIDFSGNKLSNQETAVTRAKMLFWKNLQVVVEKL